MKKLVLIVLIAVSALAVTVLDIKVEINTKPTFACYTEVDC